MIRFLYVIAANIHRVWMIPKMGYLAKHPEKFSEEYRYEYDKHCIRLMNHRGRIFTTAYGQENLPKEGGYVMFANHQGKYDALGIMLTHDRPCAVVMNHSWSCVPLVRQFIEMVQGKWLKLNDLRQAAGIIREVTREVREGRRFLIFPSGGYKHRNGNYVDPFKPGSFKSAMKAKAPIVPVALIDSWKVFDLWSLRRVHTKVIYLKPLYYEEYKEMSSVEVCSMVYQRICRAVEEAVNHLDSARQ
ncbi:MAG: 1-acyl-sn-glycerol-3-phosphate acyltransferase [Clostridiaceae bacterium]|nr:1-acyl-sn-glycerol-3-phosphate acyltransferase [Clostridiaceae bacterium]